MRLRSPHIFLSWLLKGAWLIHSDVKKQLFWYKESILSVFNFQHIILSLTIFCNFESEPLVDSTQSTRTSISSRTQDQHNQVLLIHSLLPSPCHFSQACFLCFGRNTFTAQRHFGIICVLPGLWSFVFSVCVLPWSCEREGGPGPSLKTLCDLLSPARLAWASQPPRPPSQSSAICYISLLAGSNSCFMFWK